jgi:hypothetical protein
MSANFHGHCKYFPENLHQTELCILNDDTYTFYL